MQASAAAVAAGAAAANGARNGYGYENRRMSKVSKRSHRSSIGHSIYIRTVLLFMTPIYYFDTSAIIWHDIVFWFMVFPRFYQFLRVVITKLFCTSKQGKRLKWVKSRYVTIESKPRSYSWQLWFWNYLSYITLNENQKSKQKQFSDRVAQIIVNPGKLSEINKQFYDK